MNDDIHVLPEVTDNLVLILYCIHSTILRNLIHEY